VAKLLGPYAASHARAAADQVVMGDVYDMSRRLADVLARLVEPSTCDRQRFGGTVSLKRSTVLHVDTKNKPDVAHRSARDGLRQNGLTVVLADRTPESVSPWSKSRPEKVTFFAIGGRGCTRLAGVD